MSKSIKEIFEDLRRHFCSEMIPPILHYGQRAICRRQLSWRDGYISDGHHSETDAMGEALRILRALLSSQFAVSSYLSCMPYSPCSTVTAICRFIIFELHALVLVAKRIE